jgi:Cof subfamily protein (haloacid dehalogenase superfamily)
MTGRIGILGKYDGYLLLSDMDGTLLSPDGTVSEGNRAAILEFVQGGGLFSVATGRTHDSAWTQIHDLPINCPAIIYNGGGVYDFQKKEFLQSRCFHRSEVEECLLDVMDLFPDITVMAFERERIAVLSGGEWVDDLPEEEQPHFTRTDISEVKDDVFKLIFISTDLRVAELRLYMNTHPMAVKSEVVLTSGNCLELLPKGVSKGMALEWLRRHLGIPVEKTIAIGDYENDAEMLRVAGIAAAPENAHPDILALADIVVSSHGEDAVADLIQKVFG